MIMGVTVGEVTFGNSEIGVGREAFTTKASQRQVFPVDLELMGFADLLGQGEDGFVVEFLHGAAVSTAEMAVSMLGVVERIMHLIVSGVHTVYKTGFKKTVEGAVHRGQIQPGQYRLRQEKKIFSGEMLMPLHFAQKLQKCASLDGHPQAAGAQKFEIVGHVLGIPRRSKDLPHGVSTQ